ncbi:MAG: alpha/beta hydrolase [Paludisphaera borealis]|uniref:alpha/beta hydrolase n=1 Tax=Paludisphaera borealis TaxID=1387353 RepID=UPI0028513D51|nr:alpha/beta hydrolase [Paludisphaera borealis]MDR3620897.1 alpha/beta hydrolase [Paludisphaera borealis]
MSSRTLAYFRGVGWIAAAVATTFVWARSVEKTTEPPLPEGVTVVRDVTYRVIDGRRLALDLYLPAESGPELRPTIVAVHGGSWVGGSKRDYGPQFARFAKHGFVVAVVDYRLARPGAPSWDKAFEDVAAAVDWLGDHAESYAIDAGRLAAIGTSAGGMLAAHLGLGTPVIGDKRPRHHVRASVCLSTPTSLAKLITRRSLQHDPVLDLIGHAPGVLETRGWDASPIDHVSAGSRPILLIHGTDDSWVLIDQAREMRDKLERMGIPNRLIEIVGARHGFELRVEAPSPRDLLPDVLDFLNEVWRERASDAA